MRYKLNWAPELARGLLLRPAPVQEPPRRRCWTPKRRRRPWPWPRPAQPLSLQRTQSAHLQKRMSEFSATIHTFVSTRDTTLHACLPW